MRLVKTKIFNFLLVFLFLICFNNYSWSQSNTPPTVTALGNQSYCPLSQINIVTDFNVTGGTDEIEAIYIGLTSLFIS